MRALVRRPKSLSLLLMLVLPIGTVYPHGGGLDQCGGHHDRKQGGYHVHNRRNYCGCYPANCAPAKPKVSILADASTSKTLRAYSCDNAHVGGSKCFPVGDPKQMTVALYPESMKGEPVRLSDDGNGVLVNIVAQRVVLDQRWLQVETSNGRRGWIVAGYVK